MFTRITCFSQTNIVYKQSDYVNKMYSITIYFKFQINPASTFEFDRII